MCALVQSRLPILLYFDSVLLCSPKWSQNSGPSAFTYQELGLQALVDTLDSQKESRFNFPLQLIYKSVCRLLPSQVQIATFH